MTTAVKPRDTLSMRVRIARIERELSQRAAALTCGLTFGEWQGIEDGRKVGGLDVKVRKIAAGLGYDRDWLMWGGPLSTDGEEPPVIHGYGSDICLDLETELAVSAA